MCWKHLPEEVEGSRTVYFIRNTSEPIPEASGGDTAAKIMTASFEMGALQGSSLKALELVLNYVYVPLLAAAGQRNRDGELLSTAPSSARALSRMSIRKDDLDSSDEEEDGENAGHLAADVRRTPSSLQDNKQSYLRDELLLNVKKFSTYVAFTINQVAGEVKLDVPVILETDPAVTGKDPQLVSTCEHAVEAWCKVISATLEEQQRKEPAANGPLAEIEFWKERNSSLGSLWEQLSAPQPKKVLDFLHSCSSPTSSSFEYHWQELTKYYIEAKDNVRFLSTLERHFKNIALGASFTIVIDTLPALMNALRMVWVISRHYNTDGRMVPLMERIAWELCERISRTVNIRTIFGYVYTASLRRPYTYVCMYSTYIRTHPFTFYRSETCSHYCSLFLVLCHSSL